MRSEIVFRPASAIGYHRFYVIRQIRGKGQWMVSRLNFSTSAEARVSILLYDALDFSTDRDDGGGQTRESLFRIASPSAAVAGIDPARFASNSALAARPSVGDVFEHSQRGESHKRGGNILRSSK
jgi:hypothetical protein